MTTFIASSESIAGNKTDEVPALLWMNKVTKKKKRKITVYYEENIAMI